MKITKAEVSNQVFGADVPYGRIIEHTTELDTQGTDESLRGVLHPNLAWIRNWDDLPKGLKEFEVKRAEKVMTINVAIGVGEALAEAEKLQRKKDKIRVKYEALIKSAHKKLKARDPENKRKFLVSDRNERKELRESIKEMETQMVNELLDFDLAHQGCLADLDEVEKGEKYGSPGIHTNFITFAPGEEEMDEEEDEYGSEYYPHFKTIHDARFGEPDPTDNVTPKQEQRNWEHIRQMEYMRQRLEDWFIAKQNTILNEVRIGVLSRERAIERLTKLEEKILQKRDESFMQKGLDSVEVPPAKFDVYKDIKDKDGKVIGHEKVGNNYPQFRRREHYLTAGGWVEKWQAHNPGKKFHEEITTREVNGKEVGPSICLIGKWKVLYETFVESRKLTGPMFLRLQRRNRAIVQGITEGDFEQPPVLNYTTVEGEPFTVDIAKVEHEWAIIQAMEMLKQLNYYRELFADARDAHDFEMRVHAYNKGMALREKLVKHIADNKISDAEIEARY